MAHEIELREVPSGVARGDVTPPPSKSATQRGLNLALLSGRGCRLLRPLEAEDTLAFAAALGSMGWEVRCGDSSWELEPARRSPRGGAIDCRASGTLYRFLVASLAVLPGEWVVDGVSRLRERPIAPLVDALRSLGATIDYLERDGAAPLRVRGGGLRGGRCRLDASVSSQFLSALLMAGAATPDGVTVELEGLVSRPYVGLTQVVLERFGGRIEWAGPRTVRSPAARLGAPELEIEADASAACYPAAAAALTGGSVRLLGLARASAQGDLGLLELLTRMGSEVRWRRDAVEVIGGRDLVAIEADLSEMPDQGPTLAALAPFARGVSVLYGGSHLRLKESDRVAAMAQELRRLGAEVDERPDGWVIPGSWSERAPSERIEVDSHDDHRVAMSLALVGLRRPGVAVRRPHVVSKSYPGFWQDLHALVDNGVPRISGSDRRES